MIGKWKEHNFSDEVSKTQWRKISSVFSYKFSLSVKPSRQQSWMFDHSQLLKPVKTLYVARDTKETT